MDPPSSHDQRSASALTSASTGGSGKPDGLAFVQRAELSDISYTLTMTTSASLVGEALAQARYLPAEQGGTRRTRSQTRGGGTDLERYLEKAKLQHVSGLPQKRDWQNSDNPRSEVTGRSGGEHAFVLAEYAASLDVATDDARVVDVLARYASEEGDVVQRYLFRSDAPAELEASVVLADDSDPGSLRDALKIAPQMLRTGTGSGKGTGTEQQPVDVFLARTTHAEAVVSVLEDPEGTLRRLLRAE